MVRVLDKFSFEEGRKRIDEPGQLLLDERPEEDAAHPGGNPVLVGGR
jgi:hypothetical protein